MEARDIILRPIITEASTELLDNKRYTFEVDVRATKTHVKKAIEEIFNVKVVQVNIMNVKGKKKRQGRFVGFKKNRKKAIVTLSADSEEIKLFGEE